MKKLRSEKKDKEFIGSTNGMLVRHKNIKVPKLIRCEYYRASGEIELHAVNGHSLQRMCMIPTVVISKDEYNNRDFDHYNSSIEFFWAMNKLGCY